MTYLWCLKIKLFGLVSTEILNGFTGFTIVHTRTQNKSGNENSTTKVDNYADSVVRDTVE